MAMKWYKATKNFSSPLVGNKVKGEIFLFGEDSSERLLEGCVEEVEKETKPQPEPKKKSTKRSTKKAED